MVLCRNNTDIDGGDAREVEGCPPVSISDRGRRGRVGSRIAMEQ